MCALGVTSLPSWMPDHSWEMATSMTFLCKQRARHGTPVDANGSVDTTFLRHHGSLTSYFRDASLGHIAAVQTVSAS